MANPQPFDGRIPVSGPLRKGRLADSHTNSNSNSNSDSNSDADTDADPGARPDRRPGPVGTHGGSRNAGRRSKANTSGLAGISFKVRPGSRNFPGRKIYICAIWTDEANIPRSNAWNIASHGGPAYAMMRALIARDAAGLPQVGLLTAMKALKRYLKSVDYPIPDDLDRPCFDDDEDDEDDVS